MACPELFPAGSLTADGEAATWIGKAVCVDEVTGKPACFPNTTALAEQGAETPAWFVERLKLNPWLNASTPCPLDDGQCFNKFYDCHSMYENTFKAGYDAWESTMFFLFMLAMYYCGRQMYNVIHYATAKAKKKAGFYRNNVKLQILGINLLVCFLRVLWLLNAHSTYGWTGIVWPNWFRAILMKGPQMLLCWGILVQTLFWRDTVQKAKEMRKVLKQTKLRLLIKVSAVLLFGVCVPCEIVARSVAGAPIFLDFIVTGVFCLYGFVLTSVGMVAAVRLAGMLHDFQQQRTAQGMTRNTGLHMRKTIKKIYVTVMWCTFSGFLLIGACGYNVVQNDRPAKQMTFWGIVAAGEWVMSMAMSRGMRKEQAEIDAQKKVRHNAEHKPVTAASSAGNDLAQSKFVGTEADLHLENNSNRRAGGRDTTRDTRGASTTTSMNAASTMQDTGNSSGMLTSARSGGNTTNASLMSSAGPSSAFGSGAVSAAPKSNQVVPV